MTLLLSTLSSADTLLSTHGRTLCCCLDTCALTTGLSVIASTCFALVGLMQPHKCNKYRIMPRLLCQNMSWLLSVAVLKLFRVLSMPGSLFSRVALPVKCFSLDSLFYCESVNASPNGTRRVGRIPRE